MLCSPLGCQRNFNWSRTDTNMRAIQLRARYSEQTNEWSTEINGTFYESLTREELWELLRRATSDLEEKAQRSQ
jgi:hypothetical protein